MMLWVAAITKIFSTFSAATRSVLLPPSNPVPLARVLLQDPVPLLPRPTQARVKLPLVEPLGLVVLPLQVVVSLALVQLLQATLLPTMPRFVSSRPLSKNCVSRTTPLTRNVTSTSPSSETLKCCFRVGLWSLVLATTSVRTSLRSFTQLRTKRSKLVHPVS